MLVLLRDEDVETVASVIEAVALQNGLELVDPETQAQDIFSVAAALLAPRVVLSQGTDFVLADGLASLGIGDGERWSKALSEACGNEVIAIEPTPNGIRLLFFDDGELDDSVGVDVDPVGRTRSEELAEIAPTDEAAAELRSGLPALNAVELAAHVLRLWGAGEDTLTEASTTLSFHDPNQADEDDDDDDA